MRSACLRNRSPCVYRLEGGISVGVGHLWGRFCFDLGSCAFNRVGGAGGECRVGLTLHRCSGFDRSEKLFLRLRHLLPVRWLCVCIRGSVCITHTHKQASKIKFNCSDHTFVNVRSLRRTVKCRSTILPPRIWKYRLPWRQSESQQRCTITCSDHKISCQKINAIPRQHVFASLCSWRAPYLQGTPCKTACCSCECGGRMGTVCRLHWVSSTVQVRHCRGRAV